MRHALIALLLGLSLPALATDAPTVSVVSLREEITHNTLYLLRRAMREAAEKKAAALVIEMDTNGGRVDATEEIIRLLERAPMPTYTFVNVKAYSAGAFIAAATDKIFMAPGSVIGAATPVMLIPGQGIQELPKSYEEKIKSAMRALVRSTAQQKGHNPDVFEAMVDSDKELIIDDKTINPKGKLLTLTNEEAAQDYGEPPRPLLSAGTVRSLDELLAKVDLSNAQTFTVQPYGFEILARWITAISPLLILIGFAAIYMEFKTGGIGLPLAVAIAAFGLYFLGFFLAGLAGWEQVALFAVGLALLAVEIFLLPGHVVPGIIGICCILVALVLAMVEHWPGGPMIPSWPELQIPLLKVGSGLLGSIVVMLLLAKYFPHTGLFRRMELSASTSAAEGYTSASQADGDLLGATGIAETMLRPSGKGRFGERLVDVVTEGDLIERGASIRIVDVQGARVVVARANGQ
jgi:membrane-bound serine protease (ClpP class)